MADRFRISGSLPRKLEELGISPQDVLHRAGLPAAVFSQEKVLLTTEESFAFYRSIAESSDDPAMGLKLGTEERTERYDPVAIAALCTSSLRDALQRIARYKQLSCPEKVELREEDGEYSVRFNWLLAMGQEPPILIDACFAWIIAIARRGTGRAIHPKRVELRRQRAHVEMYREHFQCPIVFGAPQNLLVFEPATVDETFLPYNADLLAAVAPQLEAELAEQLARTTLGEQVKGALKRLMAGRRPAIRDVARDLRLSSRTLQRRLTAERVTFQQLMKEARRELAQHYLLHSSLELNETAYLLGYEDANSFFRAFHDWEGSSPGEWRSCQLLSSLQRA